MAGQDNLTYYFKGDLLVVLSTALRDDLIVYVEYIPKTTPMKNILKSMRVKITEVNDDFVYVIDLADGALKRLNYNRIFVLGVEDRSEAATET